MMTAGSRSCTLFFFVTVVVFFEAFSLTTSEVFTVGDENGWNTQVNYGSWTDKHNFTVGDILEFKYTRTEHNVYEVTKEVYLSCNASDGVLAKYQTGSDQIELKEAKKYWFICEIDGHCFGGMRLAVQVAQQQQQQPSAAGTGGGGGDPAATGGSSGGASSGASNIMNYSLGRHYCSLFIYLILVSACIWK